MESWRVPLTLLDCKLVPIFWIRSRICFEWCKANTSWLFTSMLQVLISEQVSNTATSGLCSSRAQWPLAPNFCPRATRKSQIFHTNHMLGTLDFTVSEYWAPFNFSQSTALYMQQCGQESNGQKCGLNLFFLCLQRYKFSGFTLSGLFLHPAHNESVFLIIIKKDPTKGKFIVKLKGTGYQQKG